MSDLTWHAGYVRKGWHHSITHDGENPGSVVTVQPHSCYVLMATSQPTEGVWEEIRLAFDPTCRLGSCLENAEDAQAAIYHLKNQASAHWGKLRTATVERIFDEPGGSGSDEPQSLATSVVRSMLLDRGQPHTDRTDQFERSLKDYVESTTEPTAYLFYGATVQLDIPAFNDITMFYQFQSQKTLDLEEGLSIGENFSSVEKL